MALNNLTLAILRAEGAVARSRGVGFLDNPCYLSVGPDMTDDEFAAWEAEAGAWEWGWSHGLERQGVVENGTPQLAASHVTNPSAPEESRIGGTLTNLSSPTD